LLRRGREVAGEGGSAEVVAEDGKRTFYKIRLDVAPEKE
jgi:hypothetical protein